MLTMIIRGISWYVIIQKQRSKGKRIGAQEGNTISFCRQYDYKSGETKRQWENCKNVVNMKNL